MKLHLKVSYLINFLNLEKPQSNIFFRNIYLDFIIYRNIIKKKESFENLMFSKIKSLKKIND